MKYKNIILFLIIFTIGCKYEEAKDKKTKTVKGSNGDLTVYPYTIIKGDTLIDGKAMYYSKNGKVDSEIEFKRGMRDGWAIHYDTSGKMYSKIFYKKNIANGYSFFYDDSGIIEKKYYIENQQVLDQRMNNKSIPIQYQVLHNSGKVQYVVLFDSVGRKVYENGFVFEDSFKILYPDKDSIRINSPVEIKIFTTQLPGYSKVVSLYYFNHKKVKMNVVNNIVYDDFYTTIKFIPNEVGEQTIAILGELIDETGKVVKQDTVFKKIEVKR